MAQSTQIVPTYSFPHVLVVINDYTQVEPEVVTTEDTSIKQVYVFASSKGKDNKFVKRASRENAINTFGDSNWKKYGQPLLQALDVANIPNSTVWMMRVMPENAAYANAFIYAYTKADTEDDYADAHKRKFRIKHTFKSVYDVETADRLKELFTEDPEEDPDGFTGWNLMYANSAGRGKYGDAYSLRISQNIPYEKDYGIKMYDFEVLSSETGLKRAATYNGCLTTSMKYTDQSTLINDILDDVGNGLLPLELFVNEDSVDEIYEEYIAFVTKLRDDVTAEYDEKVAGGASEEELEEILNVLNALDEDNLPDNDEFDVIFGKQVGTTTDIPSLKILTELTDDVDTEAEDYDPNDYFEGVPLTVEIDGEEVVYAKSNAANFSSTKGVPVTFGGNGYFDNPRTTIDPKTGRIKQWTYEDELEECYKCAFNGTFDDAILSKNRLPYRFIVDANYPDSVKEVINDLVVTRDSGPGYLDAGIIKSLGTSQIRSLIDRFRFATDRLMNVDISGYQIREYSTNKKRDVTAAYFIATHLPQHIQNIGEHVPFALTMAELDGVHDSLFPMISDHNADLKELLYNNRFNFFECTGENQYQRNCQNTRQKDTSDLLEESNILTLYTMKRLIEKEIYLQLYNFADENVRRDFVTYVNDKYSEWKGTKVQDFTFSIRTSRYEFNNSILHGYLAVVFRGINKRAIVEIDINRRTYNPEAAEITSE